jgi:hypothetical protein
MMHLTDEDMIGHIYGESENATAVERHLAGCRQCAHSFQELKRDLAEVDRMEGPLRDAGYGERVWSAIAPMLPAYALEKRRWGLSSVWSANPRSANRWLKSLSYAMGVALLVACAFYAGQLVERKNHPIVAQQEQKPPQVKQPVVVVVLDDHLDRSERFLVELKHADFDPDALAAPMRDEAKSLLDANRVCRKNAAQADDPELTTALDHLDHLLADAANEPGGLNAQSIAKLQGEMNSEGVLFEVRVLRSRIAHHTGTGNNSVKGGTV